MKYIRIKWILASLAVVVVVVACQRDEKEFIRPIPIALEASGISTSGFIAHWRTMLGAREYTIEVANTASFDSLLNEFPQTTSDTSFSISNLEASHDYFYRIKASKYNGPTDYSKPVKVTTEGLAIPIVLDASAITATSFKAHWKRANTISSYQLYVSRDVNFKDILNGFDGKEIQDTSAVIANLEINKNYFYRVKAKRGASISDFSTVMLTSTSDLSSPVVSPSTDVSHTGFTIHWQPVDGALSYLIFVSKDPLMTTTLSAYTAKETTGLSMDVNNLDANTHYYYRVQAKNKVTLSGKSDITYTTTLSLSPPVGLPANDIQISSFTANWQQTEYAERYMIDISQDRNFVNYLDGYHNKEITNTTLSVTGLAKSTTYFYRVRANGLGSVSENSEIIEVTTSSFEHPETLAAQNIQINSFQANWTSVADAESYLVDVAYDAEFKNILPGHLAAETMGTNVTISDLAPSTDYYFRVRSKKGEIFSDFSNVTKVTTSPLPAPIIDSSEGYRRKAFEFEAHWESESEAASYLLYIAEDAAFSDMLTDYNGKEIVGTSWKVTNIDPYKTYYYRVKSKKYQKTSVFSNAAMVDKVISHTCRLASREFEGIQREEFTYTDDLISAIRLYDLTRSGILARKSEIYYNTDNSVDSIAIKYENFGAMELFASYKCIYENGLIAVVNVTDRDGAFVERYRFVYENNRISEFRKFYDAAESNLKSLETYYYNAQSQVVEVRDNDGDVIKKFGYNQNFNAEYLVPRDLQMLLYDMSRSTEIPFVFQNDLNYFQYQESNVWHNYSLTYEYNSQGIPTKLLGSGDIPDLIYGYENCGF